MKIGNILLIVGAVIGGYLTVFHNMMWWGMGIAVLIVGVGWILSAIQPDEGKIDDESKNDFKIDTADAEGGGDNDNKYSLEDL